MKEPKIKNVFLIDAFPLYCAGFTPLINDISPSTTLHQLFNVKDALGRSIEDSSSNLIILDILSFGQRGIELLIHLRVLYPTVKIILFSAFRDLAAPVKQKCLTLGVNACVEKNSQKDVIAQILQISLYRKRLDLRKVKAINGEKTWICSNEFTKKKVSYRELETLKFLLKGMINRDIAKEMGVSISTVKSHVSGLFSKMGFYNRTQVYTETRRLFTSYAPLQLPSQGTISFSPPSSSRISKDIALEKVSFKSEAPLEKQMFILNNFF